MLTEQQMALTEERRSRILGIVGQRLTSESFRLFVSIGGIYGQRALQHQVGLLMLAIYGDKPGSIVETYDEVVETDGVKEIVTHTVVTDNEKMLLDRADGGWWESIDPELAINPQVLTDRADDTFARTRFDERLFRTVRTDGGWTFERINGMPGYVIDDRAIGRALGVVGGMLPHESHQVEAHPVTVIVRAGGSTTSHLQAVNGLVPYTWEKDGLDLNWITINPSGSVVVDATTVTAGEYSTGVIVTDDVGSKSKSRITVVVS